MTTMYLSDGTYMTQLMVDKFWERVNQTADCWVYQGSTGAKGYGQTNVRLDERPGYPRSTRPAHRVSYELLIGPIPRGLELDHLCRNRACVNPQHLEPVSHLENTRRVWGRFHEVMRSGSFVGDSQ